MVHFDIEALVAVLAIPFVAWAYLASPREIGGRDWEFRSGLLWWRGLRGQEDEDE